MTIGYGPRFLHSTGQLHKGGAPVGCFLQLVTDYSPEDDVQIPGQNESFATLVAAQAAGDFISLESHDLPVATVNLSADRDLPASPACARPWTRRSPNRWSEVGEWSSPSSVSAGWAATWRAACTTPGIG